MGQDILQGLKAFKIQCQCSLFVITYNDFNVLANCFYA